MPKIGFNAQALGISSYQQDADVCHAIAGSAPQTIVSFRPGVEAIIEGLRLANVKGFEVASDQFPTGDVDA